MHNITPQSVCILGRQPLLGLAELESLYGAAALELASPQAAVLSLPTDQIDFKRLGGSTRLASVIAIIPNNLWKDVEKQLIKAATQLARELPSEGKIQIGFSSYDIPITPAKLGATALTIKKVLRAKTGRSVRVTPNPELELNTAQVLHNHLTGPNGMEFLIIALENGQTLIAHTVAVQDIDSYSIRDRERPKRDARVGMLPPKLAQIIINLTNPKAGTTVLDPFCGTGVLLQEAILMGYKAYGTDLEQRMIDYTGANLNWLGETFNPPAIDARLMAGDATSFVWEPPVDIVAGETYLGRPFTDKPAPDMVVQTATEVNLILKKFFRNIHGQIAAGTRLCLAVPAWQTAPDHFRQLDLVDHLSEMGYNQVSFEHVLDNDLIYYREDQIVARKLLVLIRK